MKRIRILLIALLFALPAIACSQPRTPDDAAEPGEAKSAAPEEQPKETPAPTEAPTPKPDAVPPSADELAGYWKIAAMSVGGQEYDPEAAGAASYVRFDADGTLWVFPGIGPDRKLSYAIEDGGILLTDGFGEAETAEYDRKTGTIRMQANGVQMTLNKVSEDDPDPYLARYGALQAGLSEETNDEGTEQIVIALTIPPQSAVRIAFKKQQDYTYRNETDAVQKRRVRIDRAVLYPWEPLDAAERRITPEITVTDREGAEHKVLCPSFLQTFPALTVTIPETLGGWENRTVCSPDGSILFAGTVSEPDAVVTVDGKRVTVYEGGVFFVEEADVAPEDLPRTFTIVAEKDNCVTAVLTVDVGP